MIACTHSGLKQHPTKPNWLAIGDTYALHLMPPYNEMGAHLDPARHFAIQTDDLEGVVGKLLAAGFKPYQLNPKPMEPPHMLNSANDDLSYGVGTVFVDDPDGNCVEFIDVNRGIFTKYNYKVRPSGILAGVPAGTVGPSIS